MHVVELIRHWIGLDTCICISIIMFNMWFDCFNNLPRSQTCFPTLRLKRSSNLDNLMNYSSQCKKNIFHSYTQDKNNLEIQVQKCCLWLQHWSSSSSSFLTHVSSLSCTWPTSPTDLQIIFYHYKGLLIFMICKIPKNWPWQHACGQLDSQEDQSKMQEDQDPLS